MRILHLGDLGHRLSPETAAALGRINVLLCPVGGTYTLDAQGALDVANLLKPRVLIPMHYKPSALAFDLASVDDFLRASKYRHTIRLNGSECSITRDTIFGSEDRILVFDYAVCA